jgi:uncharacterized protein
MSDQPTAAPNVAADPAVAAVSTFTVVVLLLGLQLSGSVPASSALAFIPVLVVAGIAQLILGVVAVQHGEHVIGLFFCTFGPFLLSFAALSVGVVHAWWPIPPTDLPHVEASFLIGWTAILSLWLLLSVVLPLFFGLLLLIINGALWSLVYGLWTTNADAEKTAGWLLLVAAVGGGYFVASRWLSWAGHHVLPLGQPVVRAAAPKPHHSGAVLAAGS